MATPPLILILVYYTIQFINVNGKIRGFYGIILVFLRDILPFWHIVSDMVLKGFPQPLQSPFFDAGDIPPPLM